MEDWCQLFILRRHLIVAVSTGTQFFICTTKTDFLDGRHVVFGSVTDGMDVIDKMEAVGSSPSGTTSKDVTIEDCGEVE